MQEKFNFFSYLYSLNYLSNRIAYFQNRYNKDNDKFLRLMDQKIKNILKKYELKLKIKNNIYDLPVKIKDIKYFRPIFKMNTHCKIEEAKADDSYAIDFDVPENTSVFSVDSGFIIALKRDSDFGGNNKEFAGLDNYMYIKNIESNLIFCYRHLDRSESFKINQFVKKGDFLGKTANTGYIITPHLHFVVYEYNPYGKYLLKSIKIKIIKIK